MLIDTLSIQYSGNVGSTRLGDPSQERFITAWANLLTAHGWTQIESLHAEVSATFPLGAPITDGVLVLPLITVNCSPFPGSLSIGAQWFTFYDPFRQQPGVGGCIFVPEGLTYEDSIGNLAAAINANTPWFAVVVQNSPVSFTINMTAVGGGPEFNFVLVQSSGLTTGTSRSALGGYVLRSSSLSNSAVYDCACYNADTGGANDNYLGGNIVFTFTINGQNTTTQILDATQGTIGFMGGIGVGAVPFYTIIANPFGFAVFDEPWDATTQFLRSISVFAMAPYFPTIETVPPTEHFVPAYAVFVINPNQIGGAPSWNSFYMVPSVMCLDASPFQTNGFNPSARLLAYRSPGQPLLTPQSVFFHYGAYVQFGSGHLNTDPAWVVGKLWDVCLVTGYIGESAVIDGRSFLAMGGSDGTNEKYTVCTVMMAAGAPEGDTRTGTVNLFGDGVTWVSGQQFIPEMAGAPITIAGTTYIVASVTDSTHLVLTTALTIASGVTYTSTDPTVVETGGQSPLCIAAPGGSGGASVFSNSGH